MNIGCLSRLLNSVSGRNYGISIALATNAASTLKTKPEQVAAAESTGHHQKIT